MEEGGEGEEGEEGGVGADGGAVVVDAVADGAGGQGAGVEGVVVRHRGLRASRQAETRERERERLGV